MLFGFRTWLTLNGLYLPALMLMGSLGLNLNLPTPLNYIAVIYLFLSGFLGTVGYGIYLIMVRKRPDQFWEAFFLGGVALILTVVMTVGIEVWLPFSDMTLLEFAFDVTMVGMNTFAFFAPAILHSILLIRWFRGRHMRKRVAAALAVFA